MISINRRILGSETHVETAASAVYPKRKRGTLDWRKRVGVEPTNDGIARRSPVLKTGTITGPHALPL
jgi:hypothetical protein